jgi:hypothetical protein
MKCAKSHVEIIAAENVSLRDCLSRMIKLACTGDWDGKDPMEEAEELLK